jgi:hypothetical protein
LKGLVNELRFAAGEAGVLQTFVPLKQKVSQGGSRRPWSVQPANPSSRVREMPRINPIRSGRVAPIPLRWSHDRSSRDYRPSRTSLRPESNSRTITDAPEPRFVKEEARISAEELKVALEGDEDRRPVLLDLCLPVDLPRRKDMLTGASMPLLSRCRNGSESCPATVLSRFIALADFRSVVGP